MIRNIWGDDTPPSWGTPPVQPTQLRQMTYLALAAGCSRDRLSGRCRADAENSGGRPRACMIEMGFLNFEIDLCEQILAQNEDTIREYGVFDPEPLPVPSERRPVAEPSADSREGAEPPGRGMVAAGDTLSRRERRAGAGGGFRRWFPVSAAAARRRRSSP